MEYLVVLKDYEGYWVASNEEVTQLSKKIKEKYPIIEGCIGTYAYKEPINKYKAKPVSESANALRLATQQKVCKTAEEFEKYIL